MDAVLFDLDGTLCTYRRSADEVLDVAFEAVGVERFFGKREYLNAFVEHTDVGDDVRDIRRACFATIASDHGHDRSLGRDLADAFAAERDHGNVEFLPGAARALDALAENHPLGIVTNGDPWMQSQKLDGLGIADRFETVVHAGYDTAAKPEPEPFHAALDAIGVNGGRAVHVGNSLVSDVPGARAADIEAAWLDDGAAVDWDDVSRPDYVLDSMGDLVDPPWA